MEMICNGEFMSKAPDEACDYFDLLAKNAQVWETTESSDKANYGPSYKGGLYYLKEEDVLNSLLANLIRKVEVIELSKIGVTKTSAPIENSCGICETNTHFTKEEVLHDDANAANAYQRQFSLRSSKTHNPNWRNHPNISWRNGPSVNEPQGSSSYVPYVPPDKKTLEDTLQALIQGQT